MMATATTRRHSQQLGARDEAGGCSRKKKQMNQTTTAASSNISARGQRSVAENAKNFGSGSLGRAQLMAKSSVINLSQAPDCANLAKLAERLPES